jgi:sugar (pentulose or hexulose) kinase
MNRLPTGLVVYPLIRKGERMPFVSSRAEGFVTGEAKTEEELYAGYLEGISLVTAWSIEEAEKIGADVDGDFFLSGGGGRGKTLGRLIASGLGKNLVRTLEPDATMGSALLAAAWVWHKGSVSAAQARMVRRDEVFESIPEMKEPLKEKLEALKKECQKRGYV